MRKCADWLQGYIEYTADFEAPSAFAKWVGVLTLSAAAGHHVWFEELNGERIWPNLYVVLVGPSGVGKGQAMREALPFIHATGMPISPNHMTIQRLVETMDGHPVQHPTQGFITPYLVWAEELPAFMGLDSWRNGMLQQLTDIFDCGSLQPDGSHAWRSELKNKGHYTIVEPYLCLLGGSTPSGIYDTLPPASVGQGFTSRVIFAWAEKYTKRVPEKPWTEKHQKLFADLMNDIEVISKIDGGMKLSDSARVLWNDYYRHRPDPTEEFGDERLQGFAARKPFYIKKLATLVRLSDPEPGMEIEMHHMERATQLLDEISISLLRIYDEIAPSNVMRHYSKVIKWMIRMGGQDIGHSELYGKFSHSLEGKEFREVMAGLVDRGSVIESQVIVNKRVVSRYSLTKKGSK